MPILKKIVVIYLQKQYNKSKIDKYIDDNKEVYTLADYKQIAIKMSNGDTENKAVKWFDKKIEESKDGENQIVKGDKKKMLWFIESFVWEQEGLS